MPNTITLARLAATPLLGVAIGAGAYDAALGGVVVAGVSDWVDGALSRRYGWGSVLGSYLDPLADKVWLRVRRGTGERGGGVQVARWGGGSVNARGERGVLGGRRLQISWV